MHYRSVASIEIQNLLFLRMALVNIYHGVMIKNYDGEANVVLFVIICNKIKM